MRTRIFAIAALAAAIGAPIAAQAQSNVTVGVAPGPGVAVTESGGIAVDQRPAFREYVDPRARAELHDTGSRGGRRRAAGNRRDLLRRAADLRRDALPLHGR